MCTVVSHNLTIYMQLHFLTVGIHFVKKCAVGLSEHIKMGKRDYICLILRSLLTMLTAPGK
jgi:hypothetical protein